MLVRDNPKGNFDVAEVESEDPVQSLTLAEEDDTDVEKGH